MSYSLYITKSDIRELKRIFIEQQDWERLVDNDPTLAWVEHSSRLSEALKVNFRSKTAAVWFLDEHTSEAEALIFELGYNGRMLFGYRGPGPATQAYLVKILEVARELGAFVQGENGEIITEPTLPGAAPATKPGRPKELRYPSSGHR